MIDQTPYDRRSPLEHERDDVTPLRKMIEAVEAEFPALPALTAEVDPRNAGSLRLLARLGFRETHRAERTLLWRDEWCDSVYLARPRGG